MILIRNGYIKPMVGDDIEKGCVLIGDDGKIVAVGKEILPPEGASVIDAEGRLVTPGCVEAHCHIGFKDYPSPDTAETNEIATEKPIYFLEFLAIFSP